MTAIRSQWALLSDPKEINAEFCLFYASLHSSEISLDKDRCKNFSSNLELPSLTQEEANYLSRPITLTEFHKAIIGMKKGKSPGWDGIPPEFYITFWNELGQLFLDMIPSSIEEGSFVRDASSAIIAVLPKPNKVPTLCRNDRPLNFECMYTQEY